MNVDFIDAEWIKRYCEIEIHADTDRWERNGRPLNDAWVNGAHSGYVRALEQLKSLIQTLEHVEEKNEESRGADGSG